MSSEIFGRHRRAKTSLVNKGLLSSLIFCVCVWLLCLLRHSSIWSEHCGGIVHFYAGRKELGAWSVDKVVCDSDDDHTRKYKGIGNVVFRGNQKAKDQKLSFHDEDGYVVEKYRNEVETEPGLIHLYQENSEQTHLNSEAAEPDEKEEDNESGYNNMSEQLDHHEMIKKNEESSDEDLSLILNETGHEFPAFHDENGIQDMEEIRLIV